MLIHGPSIAEPDAGALKAACMWSDTDPQERPVAITNLEDAGKEDVHCEHTDTLHKLCPFEVE